jgi:RimJ/RimL family protein N-acetyltransferase
MSDTLEDLLEHNGVKGMKWGIVKDKNKSGGKSSRAPELMLTKTFPSGDSVSIYKNPEPRIAAAIARISPSFKERLDKGAMFTLKDKDGQKVGDAGFYRTSKTELSLDWVGIKPKHRGKGYASAALQGVVKYAQTEGIKKLTLEVPGNAPDARHIYEKLGFRDDAENQKKLGPQNPDEDAAWGGLTAMSLSVDSLKHEEVDDVAWESAFADQFAQMLSESFDTEGNVMAHGENTDEFLAHFGVKGMKWGVRKDDALRGSTSVSEAHEDAVKAQAAKDKIKVSGVKSLSNTELQALVTRQNLEQNYVRLNPARVSAGKNFAKTASQIGSNAVKNTAQELTKAAVKTAADAAIKSISETAKKAAVEGATKMKK